ncbi:MAG TPA: AAA family ATPase [Vicinamibacterales bacterium]|jgi:DNA-binding winged helix-turn-helix (wHTH) protein/tetratricopeptide (TPR) repeat protein
MQPDKPVTFAGFRLDAYNEQLWRGTQAIALRPKAFAVLRHLVEHAGQLVTKQQLLEAVWPGTFVTDAVLKDSIRQLRDALGDDAATPHFIETAHRRGYRFIGRISDEHASTTRPTSHSERPPAATARPSNVLGREAELGTLIASLERALEGERQLLFVTGEPGIGKTTLTKALRDEAAARGIRVASGQCLEHYGAGEAFLPVLEILSRLCRPPEGDRVIGLLRRYAPTWLLELPSVLSEDDRATLRQHAGGVTRERMLRELAEAVEAISAESPLLIVLEDLHWSDFSTLDVISYLARHRDPARLLVIGTYRPVDVILGDHPLKAVKRELQAHGLCREVPLELLPEAAVAEYLAVTFAPNQLPAWLVRLIHRRTEGNPLFMVNLVEYLLAEHIIVERSGQWQLQGEYAQIDSGIPENVRQLIERQIDRLSADERRVLEGASVVGMECSSAAIAAGLEETSDWVDQQCEALVRRHQFLSPARIVELPDGTITARYKFTHILYLEVPYRLLPAMRRSQIHRRIGHSGEAIYGTRVGEIAAELAMHFEQGKDAPRAVRYLLLAAEIARHRSAHHEAEALARRGLSALGSLPESPERDQQELSLRIVLGVSVMALKGFAADEVRDIYQRAIDIGGREDSSPQSFMAHWLLGLFHYFRAEMHRSHVIATQLVDRARRMDNSLLSSEATLALGVVLVDMGEFNDALDHLETVPMLGEGQRDRAATAFAGQDPVVTSECYAAKALWALGYPDRAVVHLERAFALAGPAAPAETRVIASYFAAHLYQLRGDARTAQHHAESAILLADDYGLSTWLALARVIRGWARVEQGAIETGIAELQRGLDTYLATGARLWRAQSVGLLAQALTRAGRHEDAMGAIAEALDLIRETGEDGSAADLHRTQGDLLLALAAEVGSPRGGASAPRSPVASRIEAQAEECLTRARTVARAQQAKAWELRAVTSLARLYIHQGRETDAAQVVTPVLEWFSEGHDTADLHAARVMASGRLSDLRPGHAR